ncbi:hypothetical protein BDZ89DRAFT_378499 [Hymenopellis radicata]|nr:hypothetical protein BDZ89DRAFT_378499 [Hymenopellis radicata]
MLNPAGSVCALHASYIHHMTRSEVATGAFRAFAIGRSNVLAEPLNKRIDVEDVKASGRARHRRRWSCPRQVPAQHSRRQAIHSWSHATSTAAAATCASSIFFFSVASFALWLDTTSQIYIRTFLIDGVGGFFSEPCASCDPSENRQDKEDDEIRTALQKKTVCRIRRARKRKEIETRNERRRIPRWWTRDWQYPRYWIAVVLYVHVSIRRRRP